MSRYLERIIVKDLCAHLAAAGFDIVSVDDGGDEVVKVTDAEAAVEAIFSVDEAGLIVRKPGSTPHGILLIPGNDVDIISDWNYRKGDPDGFNAAMDTFDTERYA